MQSETLVVSNTGNANGTACMTGLNLGDLNTSGTAQLILANWSGGNATPVVCATAGSVKVSQQAATGAKPTLTINAQFTDGTMLTDYVMSF